MATPPSDDATKRPADSHDVDDAADDAPIDEKPSSSLKKKGKKKGKKQKSREDGTEDAAAAAAGGAGSAAAAAAAMRKLQLQTLLGPFHKRSAPRTEIEAKSRSYEFWKTQPVPQFEEKVTANEAIEADKEEIRPDPYTLPDTFEWDTLDLDQREILDELYMLLWENYVEDDDNMFRFDYSREFLLWALKPPGWKLNWHCGVRAKKNKKLLGFISGVPARIKIYDHVQVMVEINFLCVHKKLRSKRVAPVLIKEITRRVHMEGIFQAVYTAGVVLPKPVAVCRYWHRSLNPKKLIAVKFSHLSRHMTMQRTIRLYRLPMETKTEGLRLAQDKDMPRITQLLNDYLQKFDLCPVFHEEEVRHWFSPQENIIYCYVVENKETKAITDMISFYSLPSTVMDNPEYNDLRAAYSFYNVSTITPLVDLIQDALIIAKNAEFDVFNALNVMENKTFLEKLKFGIGDGNLHYYLYNWRCPSMDANKVALVLQ
ncbi:glycylpeptide N-tetradecanoyltransferase 2-like [Oscarella lobularis]|uniref:glycylpeptide N-tetradecanoyltransferase 2-like n=1 Tax=Oscarella lobularis TaxID=121494 RepID=UPI0033142A3F